MNAWFTMMTRNFFVVRDKKNLTQNFQKNGNEI